MINTNFYVRSGIYEIKDIKYVNLNGLKGKYTIYYRIDGKVYKTDYYIEV